ncbi:TRAP transporter substrate-binding protein [Salinispira pacifica]
MFPIRKARHIFWMVAASLLLVSFGAYASGTKESSSSASSSSQNSSQTSQTVLHWKLADDQPADYPTVKADEYFAKLVKEQTNGKFDIKVFYGGQLGAETQTVQQTISGVIQLNRVNAAPLASFVGDMSVLSLPYIFTSSDGEWKVLYGAPGNQILQSMQKQGLMGLTYYDSGQRSFFTRKTPIESPSDMKGLKIRVQKSPVFVDMVKALGGSPVPMAYGDVFTGLQTGVIDGAENNIPSYVTMSFYQVAPYYSYDGHSRVPEVLFMNLKAWNSLSSAEQSIFKKAAHEASMYERKLWAQKVQTDLKKLQSANVHLYHLTADQVKKFQDAVQPVYKQYSQYSSLINAIKNDQ